MVQRKGITGGVGRRAVRLLVLSSLTITPHSFAAEASPAVRSQFEAYTPPLEPQPRPQLSIREIRQQASIENFEVLGQALLTWPGAGGQIALRGDYAYVALQPPAVGLDIVDIRNPERPARVRHVPPPGPGVQTHKVRICGDTMVTNAERNRFDEPAHWQGGLAVWTLADPLNPKLIAFLKTPGDGVHRIFYDCDTQRIYMNTNDEGFLDKIEWIVDLTDPRKPSRIGRFWFPGQKQGEPRAWKPAHPFASFTPAMNVHVHNVTPVGNYLYAAWWDAGLTIWDIRDVAAPQLLGSASTSPPDQGSMHSAWPLRGYPLVVTSDEWFMSCPQGYVRVWNVADPAHPLQISTYQVPAQKNCARSGPSDRPVTLRSAHSFAEPPTLGAQDWPVNLLFATWFGEGLRVIDLADPYAPTEVGHFLPPPWPGATDIVNDLPAFYASDVAIDWKRRLVLVTDRADQGGAGLYILRWIGPDVDRPIQFTPQ